MIDSEKSWKIPEISMKKTQKNFRSARRLEEGGSGFAGQGNFSEVLMTGGFSADPQVKYRYNKNKHKGALKLTHSQFFTHFEVTLIILTD